MSKIKHLLLGSIQLRELVKLKVLQNQLKIHLISFVRHERKEQLHNKSKTSKRTRRYFAKQSNFQKSIILTNKNETNDIKCKLMPCSWEISSTKLKYQYLGLYKKLDHFLLGFKDQIKIIATYYIYFNDQTFYLQKKITQINNILLKALLK